MADRPIGYWLKQADRLIEESFDALIGAEHLSRRHWQVLNVLAAGPTGLHHVEQTLSPFLAPGDGTAAGVVADLVARGWASDAGTPSAPGFALTDEGAREFTRLRERVDAHRVRLLRDVSDEEYRTTVRVLGRICANAAG